MADKPEKTEKDRAAILAEREAKKLAKKAKATSKLTKEPQKTSDTKPSSNNAPGDSKNTKNIVKTELDTHSTTTMNCESNDVKSKAELRAERRAKQEAQRAAKAATLDTKKPNKINDTTVKITAPAHTTIKSPQKSTSTTVSSNQMRKMTSSLQQAQLLFNHLYIDRHAATVSNTEGIHPAIIRLGIQYQKGVIIGSNARCVAMLTAIKEMIKDFKTPEHEEYGRSVETTLQKCTQFLHSCRPLSVSMTNTLRFLKFQLTLFANNISDEDAAVNFNDTINTYIREQIEMAGQAISITVQPKITNGDIILTYGCSSLIQHILLDARQNGKNFRVVVVDGKPFLEGREMLRRLTASGIKCTYVLITTTSFIMPSVSKVLLGAHALLANGYVMSRTGTAQVALMAKAHNIPVLVCCETYKFCERVQTDSFVYNEIAEPERLVIKTDEDTDNLTSVIPLNLTYDVTPPDLVTAVVTEIAILPCTSVPVILRIKPTDSY